MIWEVRQLDPTRFVNPNEVRPLEQRWWVNNSTFDLWRARLGPFEAMAGFHRGEFGLSGAGEPERVDGAYASSALFPLLGAQPLLGRTFLPEEDRPGTGPVAILSHGLWLRRFAASPGALGAKILLDGIPHTVIGILPASFEPALPNMNPETSVWVPLSRDITPERPFSIFFVAARLRPGVSLGQAQAEQGAFAQSLHKENPRQYRGTGVNLVPIAEEMSHTVRPALLVLWSASGLVLLIAGVNIANLLLARGITRQREVGIRAVLGASRWRLARQTLVEGIVLAVLGGALGILAAQWGTGLLVHAVPQEMLPRPVEIGGDGRVLALGLFLSVATGLLASLLPAWSASRWPIAGELNEALKEGSRASASAGARRLRGSLVISEIALALMLMSGAGLLIRSFARLTGVDPGFRPQHILTIGMDLPQVKYHEPAQQFAFAQSILEKVKTLPGVPMAAITNSLPIASRVISSQDVEIEGITQEAPVYTRSVTVDYFRLMSLPLERGRLFTAADSAGTVVINRAMVRRYWARVPEGSSEPLGRRIKVDDKWREIVGVVADVKHDSLAGDTSPEVYVPFESMPSPWMTLVVRTPGDPMRLVPVIRRAIWAVDRDQPLQDVQSLEHVIYSSVAAPRFRMLLLMIFALLALALASVGIYGVVGYSVTERTREIGIRMALGAQRSNVLSMVVRDGLALSLAGVVIGIVGSFAATRLLTSFLFGIQPTDAATLAAVSLALIAVAAFASYVPARRATKVDPVIVLRWE